jgi:hypothetical protein
MTEYYRRHLDDRQVHRRWIDPRMFSVRIEAIQSYLLGKGWKSVPTDRPHVLVFQEPVVGPEGPLYQWVPDSEHGRDFPQQVYELLAAIADVENRYAGDVLTDILRERREDSVKNGPGVALNVGSTPG